MSYTDYFIIDSPDLELNRPNTDALHQHVIANMNILLSSYNTAIDTEERLHHMFRMLCYCAASSTLQSYHITNDEALLTHTKTLLKNIPQT